ncbi:MAG: hypothetical protein ACO3K7_03210, partial [Candidatus Marinamargulisbacteria bacterium]
VENSVVQYYDKTWEEHIQLKKSIGELDEELKKEIQEYNKKYKSYEKKTLEYNVQRDWMESNKDLIADLSYYQGKVASREFRQEKKDTLLGEYDNQDTYFVKAKLSPQVALSYLYKERNWKYLKEQIPENFQEDVDSAREWLNKQLNNVNQLLTEAGEYSEKYHKAMAQLKKEKDKNRDSDMFLNIFLSDDIVHNASCDATGYVDIAYLMTEDGYSTSRAHNFYMGNKRGEIDNIPNVNLNKREKVPNEYKNIEEIDVLEGTGLDHWGDQRNKKEL